MAVWLSVGYDTLLPTGWRYTFVNSWCENRLEDPSVAMHSGSYDRGKFPPFIKPLTVLLRIPSVQYSARTLYSPSDIDEAAWLRGHKLFAVGHDDNYLKYIHRDVLGISCIIPCDWDFHCLWNSYYLLLCYLASLKLFFASIRYTFQN